MKKSVLSMLALTTGCAVAVPIPRPLPPDNLERGLALYRAGELRDAEAVLEQATVDGPESATAWTYLGLARLGLARYDAAARAFQEAASLDETCAEAHYGLGVSSARVGNTDAAVAALHRAVTLNPTHAYAHYHLGLALDEKGQTDRMISHLRRFVELKPNAPEAERVRTILSKLRRCHPRCEGAFHEHAR